MRFSESLPPYYAGSVLLLALVFGGGTAQGLWSDHLLEIVMLPALFLGLGRLHATRLSRAGRLLAVLVLLVVLVQFIPLRWLSGVREAFLFSPAPSKSLEAALFALTTLGFFCYVARLCDADQERCLPFLLAGVCINFLVAVLQFSYGERATISGALPFEITAGLFANENHFSGLMYVTIPLLAYGLVMRSRHIGFYLLFTFLVVGLLLAVGSRAGMLIAATLCALSLVWFAFAGRFLAAKLIALLAGVVALAVLSVNLEFAETVGARSRLVFLATTLRAVADHLPIGSGLGTFTMIYPAYEARADITHTVVNHAHNDYLEIVLETGVAGAALIVFFLVLVCRNFPRSSYAEAAFLAIAALCLHSLVDYPLRTLALAVPFAYLAAVILSVRPFDDGGDRSSGALAGKG